MLSASLSSLSPDKFQVIYADPPWTFKTWSETGKGRSAEQHYTCLSMQQIRELPVADLAADDCALFLWTTDPLLPQALDLIAKWGFTYKTVAFATRGKPQRQSASVRRLLVSPRREHSRKPDEVADRIVQLMGDVTRIELFSRQSRPGWAHWGNESTKFDASAGSFKSSRKGSLG